MRGFYGLVLVFLFLSKPVFGQVSGDTLGLTGTMADTLVANRVFEEMKGLIAEHKWTEAEERGAQSFQIYLKTVGEQSRQIADILYQIGLIGFRKGDLNMALDHWEKSLNIRLKIFGEQNSDVAKSYNGLGACYYSNGENYKAIEFYQKALDIRLKILGSNHPDVAQSFNNLGVAYSTEGEENKAIEYYQKALEINLKIFGPEYPDVASNYLNVGDSYESKGEYTRAMEYTRKGLEIRIKTLGPAHPDVAQAYNNLGVLYRAKGEYNQALGYHQKALGIYLDAFGTDYPDVASTYGNIGASYFFKAEYDKALDYLKQALEVFKQTLGAQHPYIAASYNNIANCYDVIGRHDEAIFCYQNALDIQLKVFEAEHPDIAASYNNIGNALHSQHEYSKATDYYQNAINTQLKIFGLENPDIAMYYNNLGNCYKSKKEYNDAFEAYMKALRACFYYDGDYSKVNSLEQLLKGFNGLSITLQTQYSENNSNEFLVKAYDYALHAIDVNVQQLRILDDDTAKSIRQTKNYPIYEQAISVSLLKAEVDHNDTLRQNTFTYAEKSKASLLQAQIKAADAINFSGIPDSLLQKEHDLRIDITWREKQRQSLLDQGLSETDTNTLRISSIIFDLKRDYEALKNRFETEFPEYYRLKYDLSTVSLQYVQDTLLAPKNQALLEYFVGDSSLFLFVVRPDTMIVQEVKRDFPLEDWIEGLRYGLYGYYAADKAIQSDSLKADAKRKYLEFAPKLYEKLVAPVAKYLTPKVILVPDGPLGYVPFDALLTAAPEDPNNFKSYPYLLQNHQFSYTYSATLLREMRDKKHRQEPKKDFVAFAPFYNGDTTLLAGMFAYDDLMRKDLQPLAFSGPEVAAASKLMRGETVAGAAATEERFTSMASDYRIIHLATHGRADNRVGDYAFLAFTEIKDSLENELLYVKDLYNLSLNADLVVLSACETGIGKLQRGEGIISLARAFAYAGAKSIVTSLWSVNDKSTSELMRLFYRELRQGKDKDEALRLARLRFLKESSVKNSHPFFWAAFVPLGDMRPVR